MHFVIWVATGGMVGWLVARGERRALSGIFLMIGVLGALAGGFLWLPSFSEIDRQPGIHPFFLPSFFDFLFFNVFAATFGSALVHWVRERLRRPAR